MPSARCLSRLVIVAGAIALALPVVAGTLSPQLSVLAASYHKAPQNTIAQAVAATARRAPRLFSPHVNTAGEVQVYIHYGSGEPPTQAALDALGASNVRISRALGVVQAWVPIVKLDAATTLAGVQVVSLPIYGYAKSPAGTLPAADTCAAVPGGLAIDNQAIAAENVGPVHQAGATGTGIKVGIISTGVDCIADSQTQGYLPKNVWIDPTLSGSGDEGTAMLEEVHAIAPGATLGFCGDEPDGTMTTADFVQCLDDLAGWGANIISDDLGFLPIFYNFPVFPAPDGGNAITEFGAAHPDTNLTTAAGNDQADYFEGDYVGTTNPSSPSGAKVSLSPTYTV
ncbi:MAG: hypothetical protein ACREFZ_06680, partial [Acetobacteraceae bacterium]